MERSLYALKHAGVAFFHVIKNFYWMMMWLNKRLNGNLMKGLSSGRVTSLQRQGRTNKHHGIKNRPVLTQQEAVIQTVNQYRLQSLPRRVSGLCTWPWDDDFYLAPEDGG